MSNLKDLEILLQCVVQVFSFDFSRLHTVHPEPTKPVNFAVDTDGVCNCVCIWFELALDEEETVATGPLDPTTHWSVWLEH